MTGRTHLVVGTAAAIAVVCPQTPAALCTCAAAGAVGSVISDVDSQRSGSHKRLVKICIVLLLAVLVLAAVEQHWHLGISEWLMSQTSLNRILPGGLAFLVVCWYGMNCPHRTFMHSLLALVILTVLAWLMVPAFALPFAVAMISHIILDLLNRRKVRLFYPLKRGFSLNLCKSKGWVNNILFAVGCLALVLEIGSFLMTPIYELI